MQRINSYKRKTNNWVWIIDKFEREIIKHKRIRFDWKGKKYQSWERNN